MKPRRQLLNSKEVKNQRALDIKSLSQTVLNSRQQPDLKSFTSRGRNDESKSLLVKALARVPLQNKKLSRLPQKETIDILKVQLAEPSKHSLAIQVPQIKKRSDYDPYRHQEIMKKVGESLDQKVALNLKMLRQKKKPSRQEILKQKARSKFQDTSGYLSHRMLEMDPSLESLSYKKTAAIDFRDYLKRKGTGQVDMNFLTDLRSGRNYTAMHSSDNQIDHDDDPIPPRVYRDWLEKKKNEDAAETERSRSLEKAYEYKGNSADLQALLRKADSTNGQQSNVSQVQFATSLRSYRIIPTDRDDPNQKVSGRQTQLVNRINNNFVAIKDLPRHQKPTQFNQKIHLKDFQTCAASQEQSIIGRHNSSFLPPVNEVCRQRMLQNKSELLIERPYHSSRLPSGSPSPHKRHSAAKLRISSFEGSHNSLPKYKVDYSNTKNVNNIREFLTGHSQSTLQWCFGLRTYNEQPPLKMNMSGKQTLKQAEIVKKNGLLTSFFGTFNSSKPHPDRKRLDGTDREDPMEGMVKQREKYGGGFDFRHFIKSYGDSTRDSEDFKMIRKLVEEEGLTFQQALQKVGHLEKLENFTDDKIKVGSKTVDNQELEANDLIEM